MMRGLGRWLVRLASALMLVVAGLILFGPYEEVPRPTPFDHARLSGGVTAHITAREAQARNLRRGNEMRVEWYGLEDVPTDLAIVYIHGFSASSEEIRPVPDLVAEGLKANLVFTRLSGHGRDGAAMEEPRAGDWLADTAEALAIGRAVGHEVIVIATSTGGTLAAVAATEPELMRDVKGIVFVSPNFGINSPAARLLTWPAARLWLPLVAGGTRSFEPLNPLQEQNWTTRYPIRALLPMAALVKYARGLDYGAVRLPALFYYSPEDAVVDARATDRLRARWGGPVTHAAPDLGEGVDPSAHVIAGDIVSPANTGAAAELILEWARGL
ncbi:MAG: alpha/beta fold hydrolase [Roseovarius sp.]